MAGARRRRALAAGPRPRWSLFLPRATWSEGSGGPGEACELTPGERTRSLLGGVPASTPLQGPFSGGGWQGSRLRLGRHLRTDAFRRHQARPPGSLGEDGERQETRPGLRVWPVARGASLAPTRTHALWVAFSRGAPPAPHLPVAKSCAGMRTTRARRGPRAPLRAFSTTRGCPRAPTVRPGLVRPRGPGGARPLRGGLTCGCDAAR